MKRIAALMVLLLIAGAIWAGPEENFRAGGMELGGELHITWIPDGYISDPDGRELNEGEYFMFMDGTASIGWFLSDSFSLQIMPGFFYFRNVDDHGESVNNSLWLSIGSGFDWYLAASSPVFLSIGLDGGITFIPGIDGTNLGADVPDGSLAIEFSLSPNIASYYFITDRVAPFISICPEFFNVKGIKNNDGSDYSYPAGKGFMDY
jgi:hypothetical protein